MEKSIESSMTAQSRSIRDFTLFEFAERYGLSLRTRNCLRAFLSSDSAPFRTVGEYLDAGNAGESSLYRHPNMGRKSVHGLNEAIKAALLSPPPETPLEEPTAAQSGKVKSPPRETRSDLVMEIQSLYPGAFDDLIARYLSLPIDDRTEAAELESKLNLIKKRPQWAQVAYRRFKGETLAEIALDLGVTRENVRQLEKRLKPLLTDRLSEDHLRRAIELMMPAGGIRVLPSNATIAEHHPRVFQAIRKVFLNDLGRDHNAPLSQEERSHLADTLGIELDSSERRPWTEKRLVSELRELAQRIGKPDLMPFQIEIVAARRIGLINAVRKFGGQANAAALAGLKYQGQQTAEDGGRKYWTEERIGIFLHEVAEKEGHPGVMPTQKECRAHAKNPQTIITILTQAGSYGSSQAWFELSKRYGLKYSREAHKVGLNFIRRFVESLGDALYSLSPSEIYVLFEQQGINKAGKNLHRSRSFDNLVTAMQSGYLPKEEIKKWAGGEQIEVVDALLDPSIDSIEDAFASVGRALKKQDRRHKADNPKDEEYSEDIERNLPSPRAIETLTSLKVGTDLLQLTSSDAEAVDFLVSKATAKLWQRCFDDEASAVEEARSHHGNVYSDSVRDRFLEEYSRSKLLPLPTGYSFKDSEGRPCEPKLMQKLIAYRVLKEGHVLNLSGTGTGKTLSAVLASRVVGSRVTVIACPNATVSGWKRTILNAFPDSDIQERVWDPEWREDSAYRYLIQNHEMFQERNESKIKTFINSNEIDLVVIDELHQVKQRDEDFESQRRRMLTGLISDLPNGRAKPRVLGMTATPIINNLQEGKSLIELVSGLRHAEIDARMNVQNCMRLYQKFTTMGFRMTPPQRIERTPKIYPVDCTPYIESLLALGHAPHPQKIESVLVRARWPIIKQHLRHKTVIFTEYVTDIVPFLYQAVQDVGLTVGLYTGDEKLATDARYRDMLDQFIRGPLDVLIASIRTVGTGVDGLQFVCNNVVFATLPWTNTDYEQAIGRFDREGFVFDSLDIHIPKTYAILGDGQEWSWCDAKLSRLENKRDISKAAVDGEIPDTTKQLTPERASIYWMAWLKRLTDEGLAEIERMEIIVPLDEGNESEATRRLGTYGNFANLNARWNTAHSSNTNARLMENPEEWCYYHTRMQEYEKDWQLVPREACIQHIRENVQRGSVIGDFGCGQAQLAAALRDEYTVYSMDHIAINASVMACDMANCPLDDSILDVAIFSLSLMGRNLRDYISEAYRTLRVGGHLVIYHPANGNDSVRFIEGLEKFGFTVVKYGSPYKWFYVWAQKKSNQEDREVEVSF